MLHSIDPHGVGMARTRPDLTTCPNTCVHTLSSVPPCMYIHTYTPWRRIRNSIHYLCPSYSVSALDLEGLWNGQKTFEEIERNKRVLPAFRKSLTGVKKKSSHNTLRVNFFLNARAGEVR